MSKKRNIVKDYDTYVKACMDGGACHSPHSLVTIGTSYVMATSEGMKRIEWADMQDPTKWEPRNETSGGSAE